jgi:hypothetical protein
VSMAKTRDRRLGRLAEEIAEFEARLFAAFFEALSDEDRFEALRRTIRGLEDDHVIAPIGDPPADGSIEERRAYLAAFDRVTRAAVRSPEDAIRGHRVMLRVCRQWKRGESA